MKIYSLLTTVLSLTFLLLASVANAQTDVLESVIAQKTNVKLDESSSVEPDRKYYYPAGLIALPARTQFLIWAELESGTLNLLERLTEKNYRVVKRIPISIGKAGTGKETEGDKRTPLGVYRVTTRIPQSELSDFYGIGAYPINYPNNWDRLNQRTGSGIWLHGSPDGSDPRPLLDSDGCVVVDNESLNFLESYIIPGQTPIVLGKQLEWVATDSIDGADTLLEALDAWERSWESRDPSRYLSNYHRDFSDHTRNLQAWRAHKIRLNRQKLFIDVTVRDITAFEYPGAEDTVSMHFYQTYESNNYNWSGWKELIWKKDANGQWKILFEGDA